MSRRLQCNSLSVKSVSDGDVSKGGTIECDTLTCKSIVCENNNTNKNTNVEIPHSLQISHISLGMMGTSITDCTHQTTYIPEFTHLTSKYISFAWHDWSPGYPEEKVFFKIGDEEWKTLIISKSQTLFEHNETYIHGDNDITVSIYAENDNESSIQSLSMNLIGTCKINL